MNEFDMAARTLGRIWDKSKDEVLEDFSAREIITVIYLMRISGLSESMVQPAEQIMEEQPVAHDAAREANIAAQTAAIDSFLNG